MSAATQTGHIDMSNVSVLTDNSATDYGDVKQSVADLLLPASTTTATDSNFQPAASTSAGGASMTTNELPTKSRASLGKLTLRQKRKSSTTDDDSQLFNSWLSSEIEKNSMKVQLINTQIEKNVAKKQLIDLLKIKTTIEIQSLSNFGSVILDSEQ